MGINKDISARSDYQRALRQSHKEAKATMAAAILTALFFWGAVFFLQDSDITIASFPLWFVVSCIGGYLFSIAAVFWLVKYRFEDILLDRVTGLSKGDE